MIKTTNFMSGPIDGSFATDYRRIANFVLFNRFYEPMGKYLSSKFSRNVVSIETCF